MIDQNNNGISDVWEWVYNAYGINPNGDNDGDGFSNLKESIAGTDPFDSNSYPHITIFGPTATNFSVTIPCQLGKVYQLLSTTALGNTNWLMETGMVARSGSTLTLSAPNNPSGKFFRIAVSDTNTDGSPMNDWEKYKLGLAPFNAWSNGQQDGNGNALTDYAYATNQLASQNVITIAATDASATQPDPGKLVTATGQFTITRSGFPLDTLTINLATIGSGPGFAVSGTDYYGPLQSIAVIPAGENTSTILLVPMANTNLQAPVIAQLQLLPGQNYTVGSQSNAAVVIYPSPTPSGTGLLGQYYTNSSSTYTNAANFNPTNLFLTRVDPVIDFNWGPTNSPNLSNGLYTVRWTGQVQPQYSENYVFDVYSDDGCRLWVNDQLLINNWKAQSVTHATNSIALQAGTRYDIRLDYYQAGGSAQVHLYWYSPSQPEQVIPNSCLYPTNSYVSGTSNGPAVITSALNAVAFLGQPFSFTVTGANTPLGFTAVGLPPGLAFNNTNGVISGIPTLVGNFQVTLTASNYVGVAASVLNLAVLNTGNSVVQEIWTNVPGINISDIPTATPANATNVLGTLNGATNYGHNYGERIRGYFTPPVTGNYYFWVAGSDSVQLSISDDNSQANSIRRAWVTPTNNPTAPGQNGTSPGQWNLQSSQQSGWMVLSAGQPYYIEILHKAGTGTNDNWSVGWAQDPTGLSNTPAGIVPGYLLSRFYPPLPASVPGTLYSANLLALPGVASTGVGTATLRVNASGTQAILSFTFTNLVGRPTGQSINSDPYLNYPGELIYDIAASQPQPDGTYLWNIEATGPLQTNDILEIIAEGKASILIQSTAFPNGEISGHFTLANGSQTFTPPPPPPAWTEDSANSNAAARFLTQATFGASPGDIAAVQALGYAGWISNQFSLPVSHHLPIVLANRNPNPTQPYPSSLAFNTWWQQSVTAPDQLRQRVAFALSEIMVVSENGVLADYYANGLSSYYDTLLDNAFGNYRNLLEAVTLHPVMGVYLNMQGNSYGSIITGVHANENYAREINQLFSIGLNRLWPDGTLVLNSQNSLVPTYNQSVVSGFAQVFTGWNYYQTNQANGRLPGNFYPPSNYTNPMVLVPSHHDLGTKLVLDNVMLPAAWGNQAVPSTTNDAYCSQDLEKALNAIFNNPNVGPFICRQLIQRLVTSNPSRDYLYRVVQKFNDDGTGVRGNLQAVITAILLDYEARSPAMLTESTYGKQREPLLKVTGVARAFPSPAPNGGTYSESGTQTISITTTNTHRLNNGDVIALTFTDTSGNPAPPNGNYSITSTGTNTFNVNAPNLLAGSYSQNTNVITLNISGHGLLAGNPAYLVFTTGGATSGLYSVTAVYSSSSFAVSTPDAAVRSGNCILPKISASGFTQSGTVVTVDCNGPHGLTTNESLYVNFPTLVPPDGQYQVATVPDATHFTINLTTSSNQTQSAFSIYPLNQPVLTRSGTVAAQYSTWNMGYTDSGNTYNLSQTPLRSPTVFNFFYPSFQFPGAIASAGLTTPEFQLTSDTSVALLMNFLEAGILNNGNNTNGLSSFTVGNGAIVLDVGPWMGTNYTANTNVASLVDSLSSVLLAGELSYAARTNIVSYVTNNFPTSSGTWQRDRVRAVVHQIINSPDYSIQR